MNSEVGDSKNWPSSITLTWVNIKGDKESVTLDGEKVGWNLSPMTMSAIPFLTIWASSERHGMSYKRNFILVNPEFKHPTIEMLAP